MEIESVIHAAGAAVLHGNMLRCRCYGLTYWGFNTLSNMGHLPVNIMSTFYG
jgi:hypothetical protein